ncbi:MAG: tRNA lysidine(34) synthetase TilS [Oscillospiraceae bacterium]|nr:tRNA lysidine(34) synthetase TilS [Oscillospiraceae bacterium]
MLNKLLAFIRKYDLIHAGDRIICAVSGGADSMALLWGMYLLQTKLDITLEAAHFNHHLRGAESDRDEAFVKDFCQGYGIPLHLGGTCVTAGKKGLEAAARDARYAFLQSLNGKIATAHTADDNAETVLMHMVRGTGLKGLGGIAPARENLIRPLLSATRQDVVEFLEEYSIPHIMDSSNAENLFLRNRLRHTVMPSLKAENPAICQNLSAMALRLREDAELLDALAEDAKTTNVINLQLLQPAIRKRVLAALLRDFGVREPEAEHVSLLESLLYSDCPSAKANFPGNITVCRVYNRLEIVDTISAGTVVIPESGNLKLPEWGLEIQSQPVDFSSSDPKMVVLQPQGELILRSRQSGDTIRLPGGTKSLKKLFIDRKIPAAYRNKVPVFADQQGVLYVHGIGNNLDRVPQKGRCIGLYIRPL